MMMTMTAANGSNDIDDFNDDNDDADDDDGDQYLSRKRVKIRVRILVVTEVMSSDTNGDADRKNMTKPLKHTSMSQPWFPVLPLYTTISMNFHDNPAPVQTTTWCDLPSLATLEENPILARSLERLGSNQCRCANGLAPHLWIRHWMASVWHGSWIVMAIPRLFDEFTSNIIRESAQAFTDCICNAYVMMPFSKVQCYAGDRCSATVGNSSDPNSDTFVAQGPFQCGTCPTVNGMQTAPTQVPRLAA